MVRVLVVKGRAVESVPVVSILQHPGEILEMDLSSECQFLVEKTALMELE